jgi:hypothetical protein
LSSRRACASCWSYVIQISGRHWSGGSSPAALERNWSLHAGGDARLVEEVHPQRGDRDVGRLRDSPACQRRSPASPDARSA